MLWYHAYHAALTFFFSIPGVSSSHDPSHREWNLVPFSVPL
jgi:hypothetical protein